MSNNEGKAVRLPKQSAEAMAARREIEELCLVAPDGSIRHASLILFERLLKFACEPMEIDPANLDDARVRWRYEFRLKERAVQIEAIQAALRRMLGRESVSPAIRERSSKDLLAKLDRMIDSENAKMLSVSNMIRGHGGSSEQPGSAGGQNGEPPQLARRLVDGRGVGNHHPDGRAGESEEAA